MVPGYKKVIDEYMSIRNPKKAGRPKVYPDVDMEAQQKLLLEMIVESYEREGSLAAVASEYDMTILKVRKLLITAGAYETELSDEVCRLHELGKSISEIMKETGLGRASVHSYLPYTKNIYNLPELSVGAERIKRFRKRNDGIEALHESMEMILAGGEGQESLALLDCNDRLWEVIRLFEGFPFRTSRGLKFSYRIKGNELFVDRKEYSKSITRSSVELAFRNAMELKAKGITDYGPKTLKVFGASYIWGIFQKFGIDKVSK